MGLLCTCPPDPALGDITQSDCPVSLGQIQKVMFQRIYSTGVTKNFIADPTLLANWAPLLVAADGTKAVQSPFLQAPDTEPGAPRTFGGGNETLDGVPLIIGREPTAFTSQIYNYDQLTIEQLKAYQCENVGVWLIDENGLMAGLVDDQAAPTEYYPIPIRSLFVGDKDLGNLEEPDMNALNWNFPPNWSDKLKIFQPADFDPINDLKV